MRNKLRSIYDKCFTLSSGFSVILLFAALIVILGPMAYRGSKAVFFKATVEFRSMQHNTFDRGASVDINSEIAETNSHRQFIFDTYLPFKEFIDSDGLIAKAKKIYRDYGDELQYKNTPKNEYIRLRSKVKDLRKALIKSVESEDKPFISEQLNHILSFQNDPDFSSSMVMPELFKLAKQYQTITSSFDLAQREIYSEKIDKLDEILHSLFGTFPGEEPSKLDMYRYGTTRWDMTQASLHNFLVAEKWVQDPASGSLIMEEYPRKNDYIGTPIEPIFDYAQNNIEKMFNPEKIIYWQYFVDDSIPGHYFGGIGPEIYGTVLLTTFSMLFVIPFGIISAAYLVECAGDNIVTKIIRMGINSLAGVPSIVFGLFGLAFFVTFLFPILKLPPKPCILAGSMTLAVLTLPVMIRSSEEAIRSVPRTYREASLGLGASKYMTFIKVTLPAALPGILTGIILSLSRVAGETAPILFTAAFAYGSVPKNILLDQTRTLSYSSYDIAVGDKVGMLVPHNQYGMVVSLIALILLLNTIAILIRTKISKRLQGH